MKVFTILIAVCSLLLSAHNSSIPVLAQSRPNILVIMTDDQNVDSLPGMPKLMSYMEGKWIQFNNAFANNSICCPSRSTLLTGQYAHTHGVTTNESGDNLDDTNTLPVWLDNAGYRTGLIGKYLNGFAWGRGSEYVPPGWDFFKTKGRDVGTDVDSRTAMAVDFITASEGPFFLFVAFQEPHHPASVRDRYRSADVYIPPNPPSYNEGNVSDKPAWIRNLPRFSHLDNISLKSERIASQRSLLGVDDAVETLVNTLKDEGKLDTTMIIFMSDNGFSWGAHRHVTKACAYEECSKIPLLIRYPLASGNREENRLVTNVSLAATIAEYAGVTPGLPQQADSLIPLLDNTATEWYEGILLESGSGSGKHRFYGVRVPGWKYVEYENGDRELYHLEEGVPDSDPYEMNNRIENPAYQPAIDVLDPLLDSLKASSN